VVECLLSKCADLNSNPSTAKYRKRERETERREREKETKILTLGASTCFGGAAGDGLGLSRKLPPVFSHQED
jgi:hypothetical protein